MEVSGRDFKKDEIIFRQGEPGDKMYIVQTGLVEISRDRDGKPVMLANLETGDFFGEMALVDNSPRSATARAASNCHLLELERESFVERVSKSPDIALHVLRTLCGRLVDTNILFSEDESGEMKPDASRREDQTVSDTEIQSALSIFEVSFPESEYAWFEEGEKIFSDGEPGDAMYYVIEGNVEISREVEGERTTLVRLGPNSIFGEMALITDDSRNADATAHEQTCLVLIKKDEFLSKVKENPALALYIIQRIILKLRQSLSH
jgi:CRP-like cAMP-binding protein